MADGFVSFLHMLWVPYSRPGQTPHVRVVMSDDEEFSVSEIQDEEFVGAN